MEVRTRFAPSPTGFMHIGNLRTALYAYLFAKKNKGSFILRIEDTDQERYVEGAVDIIYNTLRQANLIHDEGPDKDKGYGPYVQSERKPIYIEYAKTLIERGGAYYCFCTKERLETLVDANGNRKYDKHCLHLTNAEIAENLKNNVPYVIRQNIPLEGKTKYNDMVYGDIEVDCKDLEDNVLIKSDGMPTYNFANVVDDHLMNINYVIRGIEYLSSTPKYNLLYKSFGWQEPNYMHLPPIMKDAQRKLSKRYGDANFDDFIKKGYLPMAIVNYIALLGWSPKENKEKMTFDELIENFSVDGISKSSSIFDEAKMKWLNSLYIKELSLEEFNALAVPYYEKSKIAGKYDYKKFSPLLQTRVDTIAEVIDKVAFIEEFENYDINLFVNKKNKTTTEMAKDLINIAIETAEKLIEIPALHDNLILNAETRGFSKGQMLWCFRIAITGSAVTPGGALEMADILGHQEILRRLNYSLNLLQKQSSRREIKKEKKLQ